MGRRARAEARWPLAVVLGCVVVGLALGSLLTGEAEPEGPARVLEETGADLPTPWDRVRVEVLNAGGIPGAAARAKDILREAGFDVVYYGNAPSFDRDSSVVLIRTGREDGARGVGTSLGVSRVRVQPDTSRLVDVTVLLGTDMDFQSPQADEVISGER